MEVERRYVSSRPVNLLYSLIKSIVLDVLVDVLLLKNKNYNNSSREQVASDISVKRSKNI